MIKDHVTFSARAEKPRNILRNLLALSLGTAISLTSYAALGMETTSVDQKPGGAFEQIRLPPIPYLDTMPWLTWPSTPSTTTANPLLEPTLEGPRLRFDVTPATRDGTLPATS
jgi:hypothetical protein